METVQVLPSGERCIVPFKITCWRGCTIPLASVTALFPLLSLLTDFLKLCYVCVNSFERLVWNCHHGFAFSTSESAWCHFWWSSGLLAPGAHHPDSSIAH